MYKSKLLQLLLLLFLFPVSAQLMSVNEESLLNNTILINPSPLKESLNQDIDGLMSKVIKWRHYFHQYPELGNREFRTSKRIEQILTDLGLEVQTEIAYTGLTAYIRGEHPGPLIALRADIDGLPVTEMTNLPYASTEKTTYQGNEVGVMHACGHDAHIAVMLGVADFLSRNTDKLHGDILLIFQPAEEGPPEGEEGGAELMLKEGIFEEKPDVIFGMHVTNSYHGAVAVKSGPAMASAEAFRINIKGTQSHGSTPWASNDPIMAAFDIGTSLQTILSRRIDIRENPAVISVGIVKAGSRNNIIPETAMLEGTIRTFDNEVLSLIHKEMRTIATNIAEAHNVEATVDFAIYGSYPVTVNDPDLVKNYSQSLIEATGGMFSSDILASTGAEDFAFFANEVPGLYFWLGVNGKGVESAPGNHTPYFIVHDSALDAGVKSFINLVSDYSDDHSGN
jgi:amidohydrolase|tara:strand:- start:17 stop:1372 length:1356 start_codon:yes stop_codon:yes gene_type:complete